MSLCVNVYQGSIFPYKDFSARLDPAFIVAFLLSYTSAVKEHTIMKTMAPEMASTGVN